ncbi:MAG: ribonuclease P protein component [bacterium]|nr:ribonuclease P protein component [bacterium]
MPRGRQGRHQKLGRHQRLRRRADYLRCYRQGRKRHGSLATLHVHPNEEREARLGITASRKVGNSVLRHRVKRRVREIFRRWEGRDSLPQFDIVVHLKPEAGRVGFWDLASELQHLLSLFSPTQREAGGPVQRDSPRRRKGAGELP